MDSVYRGGGGEPKAVFPYIGIKKQPLRADGSTERGTVYLSDREGCWKQFCASKWHRTPHSGL